MKEDDDDDAKPVLQPRDVDDPPPMHALSSNDNNKELSDDRKPSVATTAVTDKEGPTHTRSSRKQPPDLPSRPLSAYACFYREERTRLRAEREEAAKLRPSAQLEGEAGGVSQQQQLLSSAAIGKIIAKRWKEQTPEQMKRYIAMSKRDTLRYQTEMVQYQMERERSQRAASQEPKRQQHLGEERLPQQLHHQRPAMPELLFAGSATPSALGDSFWSASLPPAQDVPQKPSATMSHLESVAASAGGLLPCGNTESLGSIGTLPSNFAQPQQHQQQQHSDIVAVLSSPSSSLAPLPLCEETLKRVQAAGANPKAALQGGQHKEGKDGHATPAGLHTTTTTSASLLGVGNIGGVGLQGGIEPPAAFSQGRDLSSLESQQHEQLLRQRQQEEHPSWGIADQFALLQPAANVSSNAREGDPTATSGSDSPFRQQRVNDRLFFRSVSSFSVAGFLCGCLSWCFACLLKPITWGRTLFCCSRRTTTKNT